LGGLEVDDELELGGLLDGEVGRFGALQDLVYEVCGASKEVEEIGPVVHQATGLHEVAHSSDCRDAIRGGESQNLVSVRRQEGIGDNDEGRDTVSHQRGKGSVYLHP